MEDVGAIEMVVVRACREIEAFDASRPSVLLLLQWSSRDVSVEELG
jgi:hypothetical protein